MSEAERKKRLAYKQNRRLWIRIQAIILAVLAIAVIASVIVYYQLNKEHYVSYEEAGSVNYEVHLKDNTKYPEDIIEADKGYIASLVNNIVAQLKYSFDIDVSDIEYNYSYTIDAVLKIVDKDLGKEVFYDKYPILDKVSGKVDKEKLEIAENVVIDYYKYNDFANAFFTDLGLNKSNFDSSLVVSMNVAFVGESGRLEDNLIKNQAVSVSVPLTLETFAITTSAPVPSQDAVVPVSSGIDANIFKTTANVCAIALAVMIIVFVATVFLTRNEDVNYSIKVRKIETAYKSFIQKINNEFDMTGYQVLYVDTFNEMLGIRDTIQSPVLMNENLDQTMTRFLIPTNTKILYVYEIKIDNYDEIYGKKEEAFVSEPQPIITQEPAPVAQTAPQSVVNEVVYVEPAPQVVYVEPVPEIVYAEPAAKVVEEPIVEAVEEPAVEAVEEPAVEAVEEPIVEAVEEPIVEAVEEPIVEAVEEPIIEAVEEPAVEVVEEPIVEAVEEPIVEAVEEPIVEAVEEPAVEVVEEPAIEVIEEPAVEVVEEPTIETIEEPIAEEKIETISVPTYVDSFGNQLNIKYSRSATANIIQADETLKKWYSELKNHILSYKGVKSKLSWKFDTYSRGRDQLIKVKTRGKMLLVYLNLDKTKVDIERYNYEYNDSKLFADVPLMFKIKSGLGLRRAKELVDMVMERFDIVPNPKHVHIDYVALYPYEENEPLIRRKLIKVLEADGTFKVAEERAKAPEATIDEDGDILVPPKKVVVVTEDAADEYQTAVTETVEIIVPDVDEEEVVEAVSAPDVELSEIDYVDEIDEVYEETEEKPGVEIIGVVWPEKTRKNKIYRYDPNGEKIADGDMVLVPTRDVAKGKDVIRKAAVAHGNHKIDPESLTHPLKKIIGVVKREVETHK